MTKTTEPENDDAIIRVVQELLESGGYLAVQLREVAKRAHVSSATIYKRFANQEELIVAAIEKWMGENTYSQLTPPPAGESLYDAIMRVFRGVFEPWERSPRMLEAFHWARSGSAGDRLRLQGENAAGRMLEAVFEGGEPSYLADIELILTHIVYAVIGGFANGEISIIEVLPTIERAVFRLTTDNAQAADSVINSQRQHVSKGSSRW